MKLAGLMAATHTPFHADGSLNLTVVETQAEHLHRTGALGAFVGGTTGESHSLSLDERLALTRRWAEVVRGTSLKFVVHVGANALTDARTLAAQAQELRADAISALAPSYFKPPTVADLIACCVEIASAAPAVPFYFYDIPSTTGVSLPMPDFLAEATVRIPTLCGIKFSNPDLLAYQHCLRADGGRFDMPWGTDEYLLSALAVGAVGAVGSSYNFAARLSRRLMAAFDAGDLVTAREEQFRSARLISVLIRAGYMPAAKAVMGFLGVPVGPARLPFGKLTAEQSARLRGVLDEMGFFQWVEA